MEFYGHAPGASMHMHEDPKLIAKLEELIWEPIDVVIETGTYRGTGSTRFLAEAFQRTRLPVVFHTIEVNYEAAMEARQNLARFPFVNPLWGSTVDIEQAVKWLEADEMLANQDHYSGIWTDHMNNPAQHYAAEVRGSSLWRDRPEWRGEDLLRKLLETHRLDQPLVVLDSAGGIGWLEFQIMMETMGDRRYFVLLDDVGHVKHFRSLHHMRANDDFEVLIESGKAALAEHKGAR